MSLISCLLFEKSSTELFSDSDYMQSLNLPPHADTPAIPIAGGFLAAFFTAIIHGLVHLVFLISIFLKKRKIQVNLMIGKRINRLQNIVLTICYLICVVWIVDYLKILKIKFYFFNTIFLIVAIMTTLIYALWMIDIFNKNQD